MREAFNLSELRAALRRQGVWGSSAERLLQDWADHLRDDVMRRIECGEDPALAETAALRALGTPRVLAAHAASELKAGLWIGRHPWVAGLAIPVLVWLLTCATVFCCAAWFSGLFSYADTKNVNVEVLQGWKLVFNWLPWVLSMAWLARMTCGMPGGWKLFSITTVVLTLCSTMWRMDIHPSLEGPGSGSCEITTSGPGGLVFMGTARLFLGPEEEPAWSSILSGGTAWFLSALLVVAGLLVRFWATKSRPEPEQVP